MAMAMASTSSSVHELFLLQRGVAGGARGTPRGLQLRGSRRRLPYLPCVRVRSVPEDRVAVLEDDELMRKLDSYSRNGNGNGSVRSGELKYRSGESSGNVELYVNGNGNGSAVGNGSLVKYVNGNGASKAAVVNEVPQMKSEGRKRTIEEIGQEEAWFKKDGKDKLEVS